MASGTMMSRMPPTRVSEMFWPSSNEMNARPMTTVAPKLSTCSGKWSKVHSRTSVNIAVNSLFFPPHRCSRLRRGKKCLPSVYRAGTSTRTWFRMMGYNRPSATEVWFGQVSVGHADERRYSGGAPGVNRVPPTPASISHLR